MSDTINRQAAIGVCDSAIDLWHGQLGEGIVIAVKKKIEDLPPAEPDILHLQKEQAYMQGWEDGRKNLMEHLPSAEKRTEERTKTHECDLISRADAIDAIRASTSKYTGFMEMEMYTDDDAVEAIEGLPSAEPEPEPVGCSGCRYERFGNRVCDACSRFYVDRYEAERRTDG